MEVVQRVLKHLEIEFDWHELLIETRDTDVVATLFLNGFKIVHGLLQRSLHGRGDFLENSIFLFGLGHELVENILLGYIVDLQTQSDLIVEGDLANE